MPDQSWTVEDQHREIARIGIRFTMERFFGDDWQKEPNLVKFFNHEVEVRASHLAECCFLRKIINDKLKVDN